MRIRIYVSHSTRSESRKHRAVRAQGRSRYNDFIFSSTPKVLTVRGGFENKKSGLLSLDISRALLKTCMIRDCEVRDRARVGMSLTLIQ